MILEVSREVRLDRSMCLLVVSSTVSTDPAVVLVDLGGGEDFCEQHRSTSPELDFVIVQKDATHHKKIPKSSF